MYRQILVKIPNMKHYKNCVVGVMFHMVGWTDIHNEAFGHCS